MTCASFGTSLQTSLWYTLDGDLAAPVPDGQSLSQAVRWKPIPFVGETVAASISASLSERIGGRALFGSAVSAAEVSGSITVEFQSSELFYNLVVCALQSPLPLSGFSVDEIGIAEVNSAIFAESPTVSVIPLQTLVPEAGSVYSIFIDEVEYAVTLATEDPAWVSTTLADVINQHSAYTAEAVMTLLGEAVKVTGVVPAQLRFMAYPPGHFSPGALIQNGDFKHCLLILKAIERDDGLYDYFLFRSVQISSLALEITPTSLVSGTVSVFGAKQEDPLVAISPPPYWTFEPVERLPVVAGADALDAFAITGSALRASDMLLGSLTLTIDNQLRQQTAVGTNSPFGVGVASGRMAVTLSAPIYYQNPRAFYELLNDSMLRLTGRLVDGHGRGILFQSDHVKVTRADTPIVESPEQELLIETEFRAFECPSTGTLQITRLPQPDVSICELLEIVESSGTVGALYSIEPGEDAESSYLFEDEALTTPASLDGRVAAVSSVTGPAAVQATLDDQPYLRVLPSGAYWLDADTDTSELVATFDEPLGTNCTVIRTTLSAGVLIEEGVEIDTTYLVAAFGEFNSDQMVVNRRLSSAERALALRYFTQRLP